MRSDKTFKFKYKRRYTTVIGPKHPKQVNKPGLPNT